MMFEIIRVDEPDKKSAICDGILRALPDWFGIEDAIVEYVRQVRDCPFFAAQDLGRCIGFVALNQHSAFAAEVCVMGVLEDCHRRGVGRALIGQCVAWCRDEGVEFLTVKTLADSHPDEGYAKTRQFYLSMGFRPLEVFPLLWDEANPCLFMAMHLANG